MTRGPDAGSDGPAVHDPAEWERAAPPGPHVARTLGWTVARWAAGRATVTWEAAPAYGFPTGPGLVVIHGGMLGALLDNAMAAAAYTVTGSGAPFLTADLHVQLFRPARPGLLTAHAEVVRSTPGAAFCAGRVLDADGVLLAGATATQVRRAGPDAPVRR